MKFSPLNYPLCFEKPKRLTDIISWHEHIPFAFGIMQMLKPKIFVELGTHKGDSYCAFCQAVDTLKLTTSCYAIDTWKGDEHAGFYEPDVLEELRSYHDPLYGHFSRLIQCLFDQALDHFSNNSIDLLHIDGLHTYDAVKHDFEKWLPKMSKNGIILLHDTNIHEKDFGVWKLWDELRNRYLSLEFKHGCGLGVLAIGKDIQQDVLELFQPQNEVAISKFFSDLGNRITQENNLKRNMVRISELEKMARHKDDQIVSLVNEIKLRDDRNAGLVNEIKLRDDRNAGLVNEIKLRDDRNAGLVNERDFQVAELSNRINSLTKDIRSRDSQITELSNRINSLTIELNGMHQSILWNLAMFFHIRIIDKLLPNDTRRRRSYDYLLTNSRDIIVNVPKTFKSNIEKSISYIKMYGLKGFIKAVIERLKYSDDLTCDNIPQIPLIYVAEEDPKLLEYTVSIIIPTKNAGTDFEYILAMLKNQKGIKNIEIIVVDSGSTDETLKYSKDVGAKIVEILPEKFSHSYARNIGAEKATGSYLLFTVQDALPPYNLWLYDMLMTLKNNDVVAVSCAEYPRKDADLFYRIMCWNHYRFLEVNGKDRIFSLPKEKNYITLRKNGQLSDLACLISKRIFLAYKYITNYAEDLDLGIRLIKDGYNIAFLSSIKIIHSHNRPSYYFLKRGYVDNIFLSDIFHDLPVPSLNVKNFKLDIIVTYNFINSLIRKFSNIYLLYNIEEFENSVIKSFKEPIEEPNTILAEIDDNQYIDEEFKSFLKRILSECSGSTNDSYNGVLVNAMSGFIDITFEYIKNTYQSIDEDLIEEFKYCIFKEYALLVGAHLAYSYLKNSDNDELKKLNDELVKGV